MSAAEPSKRVFMPMGDSSEFIKKPEKNAGTLGNKNKTLRLDLDLFEPDERTFPEFNYKKLVHIEKKKQKKIAKLPNGNHEDPFGGAGEDDVERIAKELEAKYGSGSSYSKSARLTTVDRGAGYDATDSFIDDTEAYDELIPDEIETDRGGFYINSGALEFKKLSNYERPGDEIRMPKAKKRALSTSSESSESDGAEEEKATEKVKKKTHIEKKLKPNATSSSDEQGKAKKSKKEKEKPKEAQLSKEVAVPVKEPEKKKLDLEKTVKTTTVKDMLRLKRDNLARKQELGKSTSSGATTATDNDDEEGESESVSSLAVSESSRDSHPETPAPVNGVKEIPMPENLPADVNAMISSLKVNAEANSTSTKFFDVQLMDQLVKVDNIVKNISANVRVQTYNYMSQFMPCTKKTLFEKVRKHRQGQFSTKVKVEVNKLRKIVNEAMPALIAKFDNDMKQYELKKSVQNVVGDNTTENNLPRKKFHWNDTSRKVLSNILTFLEDLHKATKAKKENSKEFVTLKFKEEVLPLWPEGWVKVEDFEKEIEKKKKKDARVLAPTITQGGQPQVQTKPNTASATKTTNGKAPAQKTDTTANQKLNGKTNSTPELSQSLTNLSSLSPASVIKRSSDHSINSIISASPSPPATGKAPEVTKPRVIDLEKLSNPSDLLKVVAPKTLLARFSNASPIDITTPEKATISRRSDSSDSDCVEVVSSDFNPIKPEKSLYNNNNNKVNHHTTQPAPIAKKMKKHGSDDGEQETDYSKIIMGLQSLTDPKKSNQFLTKNPLSSPVAQQNPRKAETSHVNYESNGTSDNFLDPKLPAKSFSNNSNLHYSLGDLMSRAGQDSNLVQGKVKSSDHHKSSLNYYNHQQQLTSSTNNNLHSISLSLTSPTRQSPNLDGHSSTNSGYLLPSILNLSHRK